MPLPKFLQLFMQKFNEPITEKMLYDMKHAVQIFIINNISMIALTPIMKFILDIVQILQTTSPLNLIDLKTMMNMTVTTCFEFGYPNISSLIHAFGDLFLSSNATNVHERSDIELNPECICK
jgi:meiosis arrest female protein 1